MTCNEFINGSLLFCVLASALAGVFHQIWSPNFYRLVEIGYTMVTISCLYAAIVMISLFFDKGSLDVDEYTSSYLAIMISVLVVRIGHIYETLWGEDTQVRICGRKMVIKSKVTLPEGFAGTGANGLSVPIDIVVKPQVEISGETK